MSWLSKIFNYIPVHERRGIYLNMKDCWLINFTKSDITLFIREMGILFPQGSIIYLEGTSISSDVQEYLHSICVKLTARLEIGTIWPRPKIFHIPLVDEYLQKLAEFAETHVMPQICDHLHVLYKDNEILLQGYDIFDKIVYLSNKIDENLIRAFCTKINCKYKKHSA